MSPAPVRALGRSALALTGAAAATMAFDAILEGPLHAERLPGWRRPNFRGRPVSLSAGAAAVGGAMAGLTLAPAPWRRVTAVAVGAASLGGAYDDLFSPRVEQAGDKGWRGHVRAARAGRLSGGAVKVAAIGTGSLVAAGLGRAATAPARTVLLDAALIAGSANLLNLFDVRPGRAGKVALLVATASLGGPAAVVSAATAGAAAAALPRDLRETRMLGDLGANALGAMLGVRLCAARARPRIAAGLMIAALTAASEWQGFSRIIDAVPVLRALDRWGRAPS